MMKYAGHTLISSLTPVNSVLKNHGRSRKCTYSQKCQFQTGPIMVSARYLPPWFSVAPMMDWTDNNYRTLARLISKHAWLYTEMLTAETIVYQKGNLALIRAPALKSCFLMETGGVQISNICPLVGESESSNVLKALALAVGSELKRSSNEYSRNQFLSWFSIQHITSDRFLAYGPEQHPIVLQIGGNNLENLATATQLAMPYGYDEINFNCGCPSPKVAGHGCFGVHLMLDPKFVAEAMTVIAANTNVPVTVKCRIGVDDHDSYNELCDFIYKVSSQSPTRHFIIHSRKALLNGLSPAENRTIPPLRYEYYYALLRDFPDLQFTINGGILTVDEVNAARNEGAHGVMLGRAAYNNPWQTLGHVDCAVYGAPRSNLTRRQVLEQYQIYGDSVLGKYGNKPTIRDIIKPLLGLFHSEPGNGLWKRKVDAAFQHCTTIKSLLDESLVAISESVLDAPIGQAPYGCTDAFANSKRLLPPPFTVMEEEIMYA